MNWQKASGNESRICCRQNIQRKGNEDARQNVITIALNGMLWIARGGAPWRELPERYGPWQTVYSRFRKWKKLGVLEAIFQALTIDADFENISIDSTSCKVHQSANGGEKKRE